MGSASSTTTEHVDLGSRARKRGDDHAPVRLVDLPGLELLPGYRSSCRSQESRHVAAWRT